MKTHCKLGGLQTNHIPLQYATCSHGKACGTPCFLIPSRVLIQKIRTRLNIDHVSMVVTSFVTIQPVLVGVASAEDSIIVSRIWCQYFKNNPEFWDDGINNVMPSYGTSSLLMSPISLLRTDM